MPKQTVSLIVAASSNEVIGQNNQLPWHLPRDLAYFKRVTLGSAVIMGRKTFESIGHPLPGRANIVITRNGDYQATGVIVAKSLQQALLLASQHQPNSTEVFIIGGAQIFDQALQIADKFYLNRVQGEFAGDIYLPTIDWTDWELISQFQHPADERNAYALTFEVYRRTAG